MPVGSYSLIYHLADQLQKHRPKKVLDLGVGFGLSGAIVRQYLDDGVAGEQTPINGGFKPKWKTQLIGVEGWPNYRNPTWDLYDMVHENDILDYVKGTLALTEYRPDFIVFTDVLEHFNREVGEVLVRDLMELLAPGGVLLIGTPGVFVPQDAVHGNHYEIHRSLWKWNEFPQGFEVIKDGSADEWKHYMILVKYVKPKL